MFDICLQMKDWMDHYPGKWMVAGGWAIDLHIGEETRDHEDIEIAIFRDEQDLLKSFLEGWEVKVVRNRQFEEWDKELELPYHEIHATNYEGSHVEFLLNERKKGKWRFRRDLNISFPFSSMNLQSEQGVPYLNPEIVLLYKSKYSREKDLQDFRFIFPYLNEHQKEWLKQALMHHQPQHPWLERLLY